MNDAEGGPETISVPDRQGRKRGIDQIANDARLFLVTKGRHERPFQSRQVVGITSSSSGGKSVNSSNARRRVPAQCAGMM